MVICSQSVKSQIPTGLGIGDQMLESEWIAAEIDERKM
jgi:hypothetical protein